MKKETIPSLNIGDMVAFTALISYQDIIPDIDKIKIKQLEEDLMIGVIININPDPHFLNFTIQWLRIGDNRDNSLLYPQIYSRLSVIQWRKTYNAVKAIYGF